MNLQSALDEYLLSCAADGLSPATIRWYSSLLAAFAATVQNCEIGAITPSLIRQYIVGLQERPARYMDAPQKPAQPGGLSNASVAAHVRALHAFWGWCAREYGLQNPMANIRRQKSPLPEPKAIRPADFVRLVNATGDDEIGKRNRAILIFLADTGCRVGGLISLTLENLYLDQRKALITEKGQHSRAVVFTAYTGQILRSWLAARESQTGFVFCSMTSQNTLSVSGVNQMIERLKVLAGVSGRCNPHSFRHNFAREYLRNGGDLATLAKLLGHSNISTTAGYYAVFSHDELAAFHERFSPLSNMVGL